MLHSAMKTRLPLLVCALAVCFTTGCVSNQSARLDTYHLDLFVDGKEPTRSFRQIGILADNARLDEEPSISAKFLKKAKKMGGQGLIMTKTPAGGELTLSGVVPSYAYRGVVIVYE